MTNPLKTLDGVSFGLPLTNIDTDMILPAQFMRTTMRSGLGKYLFHSLRTDESGAARKDFKLNQAPWNAARFLVALDNFGCGSSREHAPWALLDFGIRCIIAPSFGTIFGNNCIKNGILPLVLDRELCNILIADAEAAETAYLSLDLSRQLLLRHETKSISFAIDPNSKHRLIMGLDDIDETLLHESAIRTHDRHARYRRASVSKDFLKS